jgi:hypothetical protein
MEEHLEQNFGLIIAYLLPGFVGVAGLGEVSGHVATWLSLNPTTDPTVAGFLFVGLASLALGLLLSGVRWVVVDSSHHWTGIRPPNLDFRNLQDNLLAYNLAVEHNYRYYQFYANMLVAIALLCICHGIATRSWPLTWAGTVGILCLESILWYASRDCLRRYYTRVSQILGADESGTP